MAEPAIRVLLVDDHALIRTGNGLVLEASDDLEVAGEAATGEDAVSLTASLAPDVVLMDVRMPGMGGIEATRRITAAHPATRVIVLTTFGLDEYVFGSLRAGASAFLLKSATAGQLTDAIRTVAAGDSVLDPRVTRTLIEAFVDRAGRRTAGRSDPLTVLSPRELDVFVCVVEGLANAEIAQRLFLTVATVKTHVNRILAKLEARDRVHLVILGYEHGIVRAS
ncbi:response regulator transcription factor [Leucobacter allii]|uniref:Response regulator transcription factor n=1 Tax=Leucobacter allii TaxID=2932247 RepID=A0ABY4FRF6_9MICO|nr:response regulator transcription factor [Leucobacter allii]UOQ58754.1 response regulator transcription factor [Leucobacter allii]UOR03281.1 response regulator transcription factor [Leucobacter allii]